MGRFEKSISAILASASYDCHIGVAIYIWNFCRLLSPVIPIVLINAERIDPYVFASKLSSKPDGFLVRRC